MNTRIRMYRRWTVRDICSAGLMQMVNMQVIRYQNYAIMFWKLYQDVIDNVSKLQFREEKY